MIKLLDGALMGSENSVWIEDVTFDVDTRSSQVKEYLESRKDNTLSENRSMRHRLGL